MKNHYNNSRKWLAGACAVGLLAVLSSCTKINNNTYTPPAALLSVIQASPDQPPINFTLDDSRVNLNPLGYNDYVYYFKAYTGKRTVTFYNSTSSAKIYSDTVNLKQNIAYTLFLANKVSQPEFLLLTDSVSQPAAGKATFRFVNVSPDAPAVDLVLGGTVLVSNKGYKASTSFVPIATNTSATFEVHQTGTSTVLATLPNINIASGYVYTIWFGGLATPTATADKLNLNIATNAIY